MNIHFPPSENNPLSEAEIKALFDTHTRERIKAAVIAVHGSLTPNFRFGTDLSPDEQRQVLAILEPELPIEPEKSNVSGRVILPTEAAKPASGLAIEKKSVLHVAALEYAANGRAVFPCVPGGKEPATPNGFKDATTDRARSTHGGAPIRISTSRSVLKMLASPSSMQTPIARAATLPR